MSDGNYAMGPGEAHGTASGEPSTVDTAKHEAADLKNTATGAAKDVAGTAKDEAASVAREAKMQAKDLYHQARWELSDQAATQQQRIATGLSAIGSELGSMARNSEGSGIAADLVQQVSTRASSAATWLENRDPAGVLDEVRRFARRRPAVFIGAALLAGVVAGRLTRALAESAKEDAAVSGSTAGTARPAIPARPVVAPAQSSAPVAGEAPVYAESAARYNANLGEASNERSDSF